MTQYGSLKLKYISAYIYDSIDILNISCYFRIQYISRPEKYLFEELRGDKYSATSIAKILNNDSKKAGIRKTVTPHMLRHSFSAHLLEQGTDLRYIQELLGHNSSKTTVIYTHVTKKAIDKIKNPTDDFFDEV